MPKQETTDDPSVLQDFSGGLNTLTAPNRLGPTFTPSANNVWYDDGALAKRPGQLLKSTTTQMFGRNYFGYEIHDSVFSGSEQMITYGAAGIGANFLCYSSLGTDINIVQTGATGTASCAASTAVTGVGTNWLNGGTYGVGTAAPGALFTSGNTVGIIQSVNSDTSLTLTTAFGATISGSAYLIVPAWPSTYRVSFADMQGYCWISGWGGAPIAWNGSVASYINPLPIGTITTSTSSLTVTGVGTNFTNISPTAMLLGFASIATADGSSAIVASVQSATSLTLASVPSGGYPTANIGVAYTLPNFPQAAYLLSFSNYLFAANTIANPSNVQWSNLGTAGPQPQIWPPSNFQPVNPNDGFPIVGLFYDGQSNCILKSNSMWKLAGQTFNPVAPTYTLTQVYTPSDFFINSPKSIQLLDIAEGFIMLGKFGFYSYNGAGAVSKLFQYDIVRSEFAQMNTFNTGNVPTVTAEPCSIVVNGSYWCQVPNSLSSFSNTDKELTYVIDKTGAFWQWQAGVNGVVSDFCYFQGNLYGVNSYSGGLPGITQLDYPGSAFGVSDTCVTAGLPTSTSAINGTFSTKVIEFKNQHRFGLAYIYYKKQTPITPLGTVSTAVASATVTGVSTNFYSIFVPGSIITVNGVTGTVLTVNSNTSLTLTGNFGALNSGLAYTVSGGYLLTVTYTIDEGTPTTVLIDMTLGNATRTKSAAIMVGQVGYSIQFTVSNKVPAQTFEVYSIEFDHQELRT